MPAIILQAPTEPLGAIERRQGSIAGRAAESRHSEHYEPQRGGKAVDTSPIDASIAHPVGKARRIASRRRNAALMRRLIGSYPGNSLSRMQLAALAGATFGGNRKLDEALGRVEPDKIEPAHYEHRYRRGGIAGAIVDKIVNTALRSGADIIEGDGTDERDNPTGWELEVKRLFKRLRVWDVLREAFIECRKGHFSIIVINTVVDKGVANPFEQPLVTVPGGDGVVSLRPYGESSIESFTKRDMITDESNPKFGYPKYYKVTVAPLVTKKIHHSRVVHIADSLTPWSRPILERVWDLLDDGEKTIGGGSEGFFQNIGASDVWNIDPEVEFESDEIGSGTSGDGDIDYDGRPATLEEVIAQYRHSAIDDLILQGAERLPRDVSTPDISNNTETIERHIAASTGYPHAVLFGNKEGRLASEQDDAGYRDDAIGYREGFCDRHLVLIIDTLQAIGAISQVTEYATSWRRTEKLSPVERSTIAANYAKANKDQNIADGRVIVEPNEVRNDVLGYEALEQEVTSGRASDDNVTVNIRLNALDEDAPIEVVRLDNLINEFESRLVRRLNKAFKSARDELDELGELSGSDSIDTVVDVLGSTLADGLGDFFLSVMVASAEQEIESANDNGTLLRVAASTTTTTRDLVDLGIAFDKANSRAVEFAASFASDTVTNLTTNASNVLNSLISTATDQGFSTRQVANLMSSSVGLDDNSYSFVDKLSSRMLNADVGTTVRYGNSKVIVDGTLAQVDRTITGYMRHLLQVRKKRLSRSLLSLVANEGLHELQVQAMEEDLLPDNVVRVYIHNTSRHASRGGQTVAIGERFPVEAGEDANCGCTHGLQAA